MRRETIFNWTVTTFGILVICFACWCVGNSTPGTPECIPGDGGCCPVVTPAVPSAEDYMRYPSEDDLCGRYHLRKRTNRFFRRSIG